MTSNQQVKNGKITIATDDFQGAIPETEKKIPIFDKPKADEIKTISKQQEWKLLYAKSPPIGSNPVNSRIKGSSLELPTKEIDPG
jgi:hypothetical protein